MRVSFSTVPLLAVALVAGACLDVAEERTGADARVGKASAAGMTVDVTDGLAAVRALSPGALHLWANAPVVQLSLDVPAAAAPIAVWIENALVDSTLTVSDDAGNVVAVSPVETTVPTEKRWTFAPPAAGGRLQLVLAPPDAELTMPFRIAVYADVQEEIGSVQDLYRRMNADPQLRFALISGDLTEMGSVDELRRFQRELEQLRIPAFATLGNHELGTRADLFHEYFGRGNARFRFRGVQFTLLDSASATIAPTAYRWLRGWLDEGRDRLHLVTMHIPPFDPIGTRNGAFASRAEASKLLALLADGAVDITIYGHVHSYYAYSNAGIPAYITGGGGAIPERFDGVGRHYLALDIDPAAGTILPAVVRID